MSAKIEDYDVEIGDFKPNLNNVQNNISKFSSNKLCEMIVCNRYFGSYKELALSAMEELSKRRINGDVFDFESYIDLSLKDLPKLDFSPPDLTNMLNKLTGK